MNITWKILFTTTLCFCTVIAVTAGGGAKDEVQDTAVEFENSEQAYEGYGKNENKEDGRVLRVGGSTRPTPLADEQCREYCSNEKGLVTASGDHGFCKGSCFSCGTARHCFSVRLGNCKGVCCCRD